MVTTSQIAWLAGLLEGEGCFRSGVRSYPVIQFTTTDGDVARRARELTGGAINGPYNALHAKPHWKPFWNVLVCGSRAVAWMETIYVLMGERRRGRIHNVLDAWMSEATRKALAAPELSARIRARMKNRYADPEARARTGAAAKKVWADPEYRARMRATNKKAQADPELRARKSAAMKEAYADPEFRARMGAASKKAWADPKRCARAPRQEGEKKKWLRLLP